MRRPLMKIDEGFLSLHARIVMPRPLLVVLAPSLFAVTLLAAQAPARPGVAASGFAERFGELKSLELDPDQVGAVHAMTLRRDVATLMFEDGKLQLLRPLGGQVMVAAFRGRGHITLVPPTAIEQERLRMARKSPEVRESFETALLLFADTTLSELTRQATFAPGASITGVSDQLKTCLDLLGDPDHNWLDADVLRPILNGEQTGLFYACLSGTSTGDPLLFAVDPHEVEAVRVLVRRRTGGILGETFAEVATQFRRQGDWAPAGEFAERRPEGRIQKYTMQIRLPESGSGELNFSTVAELEVVADTNIGPWVPFVLYGKMQIDSARWSDGAAAEYFKGKDSPYLWIRLDRALVKGETRTLMLAYHGDLIDRFGNWYFIKSSIAWYPTSLASRSLAHFDLTFVAPAHLAVIAVGEETESAPESGRMRRTRWVTTGPIRNASFNVGLFDRYDVPAADVPPVSVLWSEGMHRTLSQLLASPGAEVPVLRGKNMKEQVGQDVVNALRFYQGVYGAAPVRRFAVTEIPWSHGEAWPGVIGLSWQTFYATSTEGFDELFRAHEVAHQWWGISVDYATYHDRWLSEGLSEFSGLWYLQTRRNANDKYFSMLDRWRGDILLHRDRPIPIWLGDRVSSSEEDNYTAIVYEKGAWVFHMLRILLLDLKTMNEDRFKAVMQTFYAEHAGQRATTEELQGTAEELTGQDLGWFFRQWVYGSAIPTYRVAYKVEPGPEGHFLVTLRVDQERVPPDFLSYVPVALDLGDKQVVRLRVKVTGARTQVTLPPLPATPRKVRFNDLSGVLAEVKEVGW
jgi:hypothetical protein